MRHRVKKKKLGRKRQHRRAMLANLASSLIEHRRIMTTVPKAKVLSQFMEEMVHLARRGDLHSRRLAIARLRNEEAVRVEGSKKAVQTVRPSSRSWPGSRVRAWVLRATIPSCALWA